MALAEALGAIPDGVQVTLVGRVDAPAPIAAARPTRPSHSSTQQMAHRRGDAGHGTAHRTSTTPPWKGYMLSLAAGLLGSPC